MNFSVAKVVPPRVLDCPRQLLQLRKRSGFAAMTKRLVLHPDRLFPPDPDTRSVARRLYEHIQGLPIVSPHGHTDPQWFADDVSFSDPASLLENAFKLLAFDRLGVQQSRRQRIQYGAMARQEKLGLAHGRVNQQTDLGIDRLSHFLRVVARLSLGAG